MFYVHSSRFGPRPSTPGSLTQLLIEENFTRFFTHSEHSSRTYSTSTSHPLKDEEPYVTSPATTPAGTLSRAGSQSESRSEKGSLCSVFRIESINSGDSARQTPSLGSVDDYPDDLTPRGSITPVQDEIDSQDEEFDNFSSVDSQISDVTKINMAQEYDFLKTVDDLLEPQQSSKEQEEINEEFNSFNEVDDLISPLDVTTKLAKEYDSLESVDDLLESLQTPKKFCSNLELSEGSRQKHEYLSKAPPPERLIMSSNPSPFDRAISREPSLYETPFTSTQTFYYSAAENLPLISGESTIQMEEKKDEDITTSRVITEHVSMITTGYVSPPPGISSSILYESFDKSEAVYSPNDQSDEEELEQFSRSDTVRRSILPGQRKHHFQTTPPLVPKVLDETRAPSVKSVEEEVKEFPKIRVESPPRLGALEGFPRVIIPENPVPSPEIEEEFIYEKAAPSPPPSPVKEEKATQIPKFYTTNQPSSSYIVEETTTTESVEETTTESFTDNINVRTNFRARSPLAFSHRTQFEYSHLPLRRDGGRVLKMVTEMGSATIGGISPALSANAAKSFLEATDKEKKELQGLNDRLGNYIDRVKRLEEQNRKLVADLDELRGKWGKDTSEIKIKYSESLSTARKDIDDSARRKAEIDVKAARLRDDLAEYRNRYEDVQHRREADREKISQWTNAIADAQSELEMLRARWKQLTDEEKRLNTDNARIWDELQKARNDLDEETIGRIDFQNQVQTLMEELEFLRRVHEQEVKELQALLAQAPADTREFFKNELALAIRDIKDEYDYIAKQGKQDMESWYKLKVSEVQGSANRAAMESNYQREEVKRMRDNIGDLRGKLGDLENKNALLEKEVQNLNYQLNDDQRQYELALNDRDATLRRMREECQTLVAELQGLLDTKQMLDAEIAIYRKMLEGEESRVGLRQMVEQVVKTHSLQQQEDTDSTRSVRGEVSTKTTFQRSAKGNVTIAECDPNGKFITLENTHRTKEEPLGEYKLKRKLDGNRREIVYTIPANVVLKPGKTMKIYARDQGGVHNPPDSLVFDAENTWGIGANVVTSLINKEGDERATHTQKTIQTGQ